MPCWASSSRSGTIAITRPHRTPRRSSAGAAENARHDGRSSRVVARRRRRPRSSSRRSAAADLADERALAEKYAPIVRIVEQLDVCGYGEPFIPTDIDLLLDEQTVALRGPWNVTDLVEIAPSADDLVDRFEYHLDFPGDALDPGCDYNRWAQRLTEGSEPVVYAHVVGEKGKLALQYWFFYPFNDFNNTHEGDWEMIQLVFDAPDAASALAARSGRGRVQLARGRGARRRGTTRSSSSWTSVPVVYPAAGSHANKYSRRALARAARPRRGWAATTRAARTASSPRAS